MEDGGVRKYLSVWSPCSAYRAVEGSSEAGDLSLSSATSLGGWKLLLSASLPSILPAAPGLTGGQEGLDPGGQRLHLRASEEILKKITLCFKGASRKQ